MEVLILITNNNNKNIDDNDDDDDDDTWDLTVNVPPYESSCWIYSLFSPTNKNVLRKRGFRNFFKDLRSNPN